MTPTTFTPAQVARGLAVLLQEESDWFEHVSGDLEHDGSAVYQFEFGDDWFAIEVSDEDNEDYQRFTVTVKDATVPPHIPHENVTPCPARKEGEPQCPHCPAHGYSFSHWHTEDCPIGRTFPFSRETHNVDECDVCRTAREEKEQEQ